MVKVKFASQRPTVQSAFRRPGRDSLVAVNPPGFCWWRAVPRGECSYRLIVQDDGGRRCYISGTVVDPVVVPDRVLPAGKLSWQVELLDADGRSLGRSDEWNFSISSDAVERPWRDPGEILREVNSRPHPRLPTGGRDTVDALRDSVRKNRRANLRTLIEAAEAALALPLPPEPTYGRLTGSERRLQSIKERDACHVAFAGMGAMARAWVLTGDRRFADGATGQLLNLAGWTFDGISSVLAPQDEPGLGLLRAGAETLDAVWDILGDARLSVITMLAARCDQALHRLTDKQDFLAYPGCSHCGRIPGYLLEYALVLADHPRAPVWADYALRALMGPMPHWAGSDGGWAEGLVYGSHYANLLLPGLRAWRLATGQDIAADSRYAQWPWMFVYGLQPAAEVRPFGDLEIRPTQIASTPAQSTQATSTPAQSTPTPAKRPDPTARFMRHRARVTADGHLRTAADSLDPTPDLTWDALLDPADPPALPLTDLPQDRAFYDVGHAFLHGDIGNAADDMLVALRSSPYGGTSHGHASQNDVQVQYKGQGLLVAGGGRFPYHGSAFHNGYVRQSRAHNTIIVDGQGQVFDGAAAGHVGRLIDLKSERHFALATAEGSAAYPAGLLTRFCRRVLLLRPLTLLIVDDIVTTEHRKIDWLLHTPEQPTADGTGWTLRRGEVRARLDLLGLDEDAPWTNDFPIDPLEGITNRSLTKPPPVWHGRWSVNCPSRLRVAAVLCVEGSDCQLTKSSDGWVIETPRCQATIRLDPQDEVLRIESL